MYDRLTALDEHWGSWTVEQLSDFISNLHMLNSLDRAEMMDLVVELNDRLQQTYVES